MENNSSSFYSCKLCFDPLFEQKHILALTTLSKVLKSSFGPHGKLKLVKNSSGVHTIITSSSQRLFSSLSVKNSFSKLIISSSKLQLQTYKDGGLRCALFPLSLIQRSSSYDIPFPQLAVLWEYFIKIAVNCFKFDNNLCVQKIDFSNLKILQSVVLTILSSKPGCLLSTSDKEYLCTILLEAFLKVFPDTSTLLDNFNIRFVISEGRDVKESKLLNGLLIRVSKIDWTFLSKSVLTTAKTALFTTSLSGDVDLPVQTFKVTNSFSISEAVLKHLKSIALKLITDNVDLVFCQKVVHPSIKKQLNDAGIAVFDQLGCETAGYLQYILGGSVNSSLFTKLSFGILSCHKKEIGKNCYILLQNDSYNFCTFLLYNYNEEVLLELKVVCQQVIATLFHLLKSPNVCFGAGCTEIYTAILLNKKIKSELRDIAVSFGCSTGKVHLALQIFLHSMVDVAVCSHQKSKLDFVVDDIYGHLWPLHDGNYPTKENTCACGNYSASSLSITNWHFLSDLENICDLNKKIKNDYTLKKCLVLDALPSIINSFVRGGEMATVMLKTKLCIFCGTSNQDNC